MKLSEGLEGQVENKETNTRGNPGAPTSEERDTEREKHRANGDD